MAPFFQGLDPFEIEKGARESGVKKKKKWCEREREEKGKWGWGLRLGRWKHITVSL